jgi:hypothetical protein
MTSSCRCLPTRAPCYSYVQDKYYRVGKALYPRISKLLSNTGRDPSLASRIGGLMASHDLERAAALSRANKDSLAVAVGEYLHVLGLGSVPPGFKLPERPPAKAGGGDVSSSPPIPEKAVVLPPEAPGAGAASIAELHKANMSEVLSPDELIEVPTAMSPPSGAGIASGDSKPVLEIAVVASEALLKMEGGCPPVTGNNASPRALEMEGASPSSTIENTSPCALEQEETSGIEQPHDGQAEQGGYTMVRALMQEQTETPMRATAGCGGKDAITNVSNALMTVHKEPIKEATLVSMASAAGRISTDGESVAVLDDQGLVQNSSVASSSVKSSKKALISGTSSGVAMEMKQDSSSTPSTDIKPAPAIEQGRRKGRKPMRQSKQGDTPTGPAREELAVKLPPKPETTGTKGRRRNATNKPDDAMVHLTAPKEPTTVSAGPDSGSGVISAGGKSVQASEDRRPTEGLSLAPARKMSFLAALMSGPQGMAATSGGMVPQMIRRASSSSKRALTCTTSAHVLEPVRRASESRGMGGQRGTAAGPSRGGATIKLPYKPVLNNISDALAFPALSVGSSPLAVGTGSRLRGSRAPRGSELGGDRRDVGVPC